MDDSAKKYREKIQYMQAKEVMMAREIRSSMKTKARDGHATIITCNPILIKRCREGKHM